MNYEIPLKMGHFSVKVEVNVKGWDLLPLPPTKWFSYADR
jgi:hypothetical protein